MECQSVAALNIELINTGTELMLGFVTNTNQRWLCRELSRLGLIVTRQVSIADQALLIQRAVAESMERAELVITTGGLGPTSDDLTRSCIAELFGRPLREDPGVLDRIEQFFRARKRAMPPSTRVQALVPEGATVLPNNNGTAPGLALETENHGQKRLLIMLPGPPRELEPMFANAVKPWLQERLPRSLPFVCRILKSTGVGESVVEATIAGPLQPLVSTGLEIGYCARFGEVDIRFTAQGEGAANLVEQAVQVTLSLIGKHVFGTDDDQLDTVLIRLLTISNRTLAVAESCTGGYLANRLTNVPGASAAFQGGCITYSNQAKQDLLGVRAETLAQHGAVSEPTAREMAEGARKRLGADYALAITGIAGPTGGTAEKPLGTVYIALASQEPTVVLHQINRYDRESFKFVTSQQALEMLRRRLADTRKQP
ncbi:MAG: competence/damage-inducible protein A [Verrucomicrobiota bacterium]